MSTARHTAPPAPPEARGAFGDRLSLAEHFADLLAGPGVERGLLGPREAPRLWDRHLMNCAGLASLLGEGVSVADLGSGAGLPGLVLAIARPDVDVALVEPLLRRTTFLSEAVTELGLPNAEVIRGRAEALHGHREFDVVTARALAPLERLLGWAMPLVAPGGELLAMKGSAAEAEIRDAGRALARLGCAEPTRAEVAGTTVVRVSWAPSALPGHRRDESRSGSRKKGK